MSPLTSTADASDAVASAGTPTMDAEGSTCGAASGRTRRKNSAYAARSCQACADGVSERAAARSVTEAVCDLVAPHLLSTAARGVQASAESQLTVRSLCCRRLSHSLRPGRRHHGSAWQWLLQVLCDLPTAVRAGDFTPARRWAHCVQRCGAMAYQTAAKHSSSALSQGRRDCNLELRVAKKRRSRSICRPLRCAPQVCQRLRKRTNTRS